MSQQSTEARVVDVYARGELAGMPAAIGQQMPRRPADTGDSREFAPCGNTRGFALGVFNDFEVGQGRKSQANGQLRKGVNTLRRLWAFSLRGVSFHNNPCLLGAATSLYRRSCQHSSTWVQPKPLADTMGGLLS
ncbi:hypothetical protein D3C79_932220 [compost metagenome]